MSSVQKIILKATLIGILIACSILGIFSLSMCLVNGVYSIDLGDFDESLEYGQLVDLEGIEIVDNRFLGLVRKPLTRDMIVSMGLTDTSGEKQIVINHNGKELTIDFHVKYKVEFASYGEVLDTQYVFSADELVPPTAVIPKTGYEFAGWDFDLTLGELTESTQINAVFEEIEYPQLEKINATYGDTLGDIELPSNEYGRWVFIYPSDTPVGDVGRQEYSVRFDFFNDDSVHKYGFVNIEVAKRELVFKDLQQTFIYDGKEHFPTYSLDADVSVIVSGGSQTEVGVYEYSFEIVDANYYGMYVGSFEIKKPTVTVTVSSATVTYPASVPEFTFSVEGFENIELLGIELQVPSFISKAGVFDIDVTYTNENVNYIIHKGTLTVLKGDLEVPAPEITVATFEDQLSDIQFVGKYLGTWTWENPDQIIDSMDKVVAYAIFTHDDPNLNPVRMAIEITGIQKKKLSFNITENVFTYQPGTERTLAFEIVGGRYPELYKTLAVEGNDPEINAKNYKRTLTIVDDRYEGSITVELIIEKATPVTDFTTVFNTVWSETLYLSSIILPEGYTWDRDYTKIAAVGEAAYPVTFTPEDTENYLTVKGEFTVRVAKADVIVLGVKDSYTATYVKDTAFDMTADVGALFTDGTLSFKYFLDGEEVDRIMGAGVYTVIVSVTEGSNYKGTTIESTVTILKAQNTETVITTQNAVYGQSIDVLTLPSGVEGSWVWVNAGSTVGNAGENVYIAKFTCSTGNYEDREVEVTVKVAKQSVKIPVVVDKVYNETHMNSGLTGTDLYTVKLDEGGVNIGDYTVTLKLIDGANYKWQGSDGSSDETVITYSIKTTYNEWITAPSIDGWTYLDTPSTPIAELKYGSYTVMYKVYGADDAMYTATVPTLAGKYVAKFTGTDENCPLIFKTVEFTIAKKEIDVPSLPAYSFIYTGSTITSGLVGTEIYSVTDNGGINVGSYTVTITITDHNYAWKSVSGDIATRTYTITGAITTVETPTVGEWTYGDADISGKVTSSSNFGNVVFYYSNAIDGTYTTTAPTVAGTYYVKALVSADATHGNWSMAESAPTEFVIKKAAASINGLNATYTTTYDPAKNFVITGVSASHLESQLVFSYTLNGESVNAIKAAGVYTITVTLAESNNYLGATATATVTVNRATNTDTVDTEQSATYGDLIEDKLTLPTGTEGTWEWVSGSLTVGNAGVNYITAKYTSTTGNYADREVTVTVNVDKQEVQIPTVSDKVYRKETIYSGLTATSLYTVKTDNGGFSVGTYTVTLELVDPDNFKWEDTDGTSATTVVEYKINTASVTGLTISLDKTTWKFEDDYATVTTSKNESFGTITLVYSTSRNGTYTETVPTDAGTYYVKAIVKAEDDSATPDWSYAETEPVKFTIERNDSLITGVQNAEDYKFVYDFDRVDVTVGIGVSHTELNASNLVFEYWLGNVKVDYIKDPGTYTVKVTAPETTNYNTVSTQFTVVVSKIANTDTVGDDILYQTVTYGDDISKIKLPTHTAGIGTWSLVTTDETVGNAGTKTFKAKFTPSYNNDNYLYYSEREITITVEINQKDVNRPELSITTGTYCGTAFIPTIIHRDDSTLYGYTDTDSILTAGAINSGTYTVTFSLGANASNYKWKDGDSEDLELTLVISPKTDYTVGVTVDPWTYNDTNENNSKVHVTVPAGVAGEQTVKYYVKNGDVYTEVTPINQGTYYVKVSVAADTGSYDNWSAEESDYVEFTIGKDSINFSELDLDLDAIYGQTLDDIKNQLPAVAEGTLTWNTPDAVVGNAGSTYTFYATYTCSSDNYNNNGAVAVKVTVRKAASVISGLTDRTEDFVGADYLASVKSAVSVSGTGTLTFVVKKDGATVSEITNQGVYTVYVTYSGDNNYEAITDENANTAIITVEAVTVEPDVNIDGWTFGGGAKSPVPTVPTFVTNEYLSYRYTGTTNAGAAYDSDVAPDQAGSYTVTITVAASEHGNWELATASCDFSIERTDASITTDAEQSTSYTGGEYDLISKVTVLKGVGTPTFDIISFNDASTDLTKIIGAGKYVVTVTLAQSANYNEVKIENVVVNVDRATTSITGLAGFTKDYANTDYIGLVINNGTVLITVADGVQDPDLENNKIVWTVNGAPVTASTKLINQGTYVIVASYAGDENYKPATDSCTVVIEALTTDIDTVTGIGNKTYDKSEIEATVTLTNTYTSPIIKYYVKISENNYELITGYPVNAGTYRIGISATGDAENGNWTALDETYSNDFTISHSVVSYPVINNKNYTGEHIPSGYEDCDEYSVSEGNSNIDVGTYYVTFTLNNTDGVINYVWGYEDDGITPITDAYTTSYRIVSADDNTWSGAPGIVPVLGKDSIVYGDGFVVKGAPKFGGFDVQYYKYNAESAEYELVGTSVYLVNGEGELYLETDTLIEDAGDYKAVFTFNDPNHQTDDPNDIITVPFTINKKEVKRPTLDVTNGIYNGGFFKPTVENDDDKALYTWNEEDVLLTTGVKNSGTYTVTFSLGENASNYKWKDGDSEDLELTLVISPKTDYTVGVTVDPWTYNDTNENNSKVHVTVPAGVAGAQTVKYYVKNGDVYTEVTPINQGTYYVKVSVAADTGSYDNWSAEESDYVEFTILPDDLDFGAIELGATYGETLADITSKLPTTLNGISIEGTLVWNVADSTAVGTVAGPNVFTVKYVPDTNGNYNAISEITVNVTVERLGINLPGALIKDSFEFANTSVTVEELFGITSFVGYTVYVEENVNARAAQYTVTITLDGNHKWITGVDTYSTDPQYRYFTITKADFADELGVSISNGEWIYGSAAGTPGNSGIPAFASGAQVTYRYVGTTKAGAAYDSSVMPTEAGSYKVYVVVAADANGNWDKQTSVGFDEFTIEQKELTVVYTDQNLVYGGSRAEAGYNHYDTIWSNISLQGILTGDKVSIYKDTTVSIVNAGDYTVTLTLTGEDKHNYKLNTTTISENVATKTTVVGISAPKYTVDGNELNGKRFDNSAIVITVNGRNHSFGTETVKYYKMDDHGEYTIDLGTTAPKNFGSYKAVVTVSADTEHVTPNWTSGETYVKFNIAKAILNPTISISDWVYDPNNANAVSPTLSGYPDFVKDCISKFTYTGKSFSQVEYNGTAVPDQAGNGYTVSVTIAADTENGNWDEITVSKTFNISRAPVTITFTSTDLDYNGSNRYEDIQKMFSSTSGADFSAFILTIKDGNGNTVVAQNKGTYYVSATLNITDNYSSASYTNAIVEIKAVGTNVTIGTEEKFTPTGSSESVLGQYYDSSKVEIQISNRNHSFGEETVTYWEKDENGEYTIDLGTTAPTDAGEYKAVVTITADNSGNGNWSGAEETVEFVIAPAPSSIQVGGSVEEDEDENLVVNGIDFNTTDKTFETLIGAAAVGYVTGDTAEVNYEITGYTKHGVVTYNVRNAEELPTVIQNAGIYIVKVTLTSNKNYVDAEPVYITVTVDKVNYTFGSYNLTATYGQTLSDIESKLPTFDHGYLEWSAPATVVGNAGGSYTFTVVYTNTDGNYKDTDSEGNPLTVNVTVNVAKANTSIDGLEEEYALKYNGLNLLDAIKSGLSVKCGDGTIAGPESISWSVTEVKHVNDTAYVVTATYAGDANHNGSDATTSITVSKATLNVTVGVDRADKTYSYLDTVIPSVTITDENENAIIGPTADYMYSKNGGDWMTLAALLNSSADKTHLDAGTYKIKAQVAADAEHGNWDATETSVENYVEFTIQKATTSISGLVANTMAYNDSNRLATVKNGVVVMSNGVQIGDANSITWTVDGVVNSEIKNYKDGGYSVTASYAGDVNHKPCEVTVTITIQKADVSISGINVGPFTYTNTDYLTTVKGNVVVKRGDVTVASVAENADKFTWTVDGVVNGEIKNYKNGTYSVIVTYEGDDNHNGATSTFTVTVRQEKLETLSVDIDDWIFNGNASDYKFNDIPTFIDESYVDYLFTGTTYAGVAYSDKAVPTQAGDYRLTVTVSASPLGNWVAKSSYKEFKINKASSIISGYQNSYEFTFNNGSYKETILTGVTATRGSVDLVVDSFKRFDGTVEDVSDVIEAGNYVINLVVVDPNYDCAPVPVNVKIKKSATIEIPGVTSGLVYNGSAQVVVASPKVGDSNYGIYTVSNGSATNAGSYTATVTMSDESYKNYDWQSTNDPKVTVNGKTVSISYSIGQTTVSFGQISVENISYTSLPSPSVTATYKDKDNKDVSIPEKLIIYQYSTGNGEWYDLSEFLDSYNYLPYGSGTYHVRASVANDNTKWSSNTSGSTTFTISKIDVNSFVPSWSGSPIDPTSASPLYYENLLVLNIGSTTASYKVSDTLTISVSLSTAANSYSWTMTSAGFKGSLTQYTVTATSLNPNFNDPEITVTVPLKIVAAIGNPVSQTYTEGKTFGTIEAAVTEANKSGGTVWVVADNTGYVQIRETVSINNGVTLVLPYLYNGNAETNTINTANGGVTAVYHNSDSNNTDKAERNPLRADDYAKADSLDTNKNPVCTTRVIVSSGISINVYTGGQLIISGQLDGGGGGANYAGQTGGYHARLVLESGAKVNVNGTLYVLGFIDDESATNNPAIVTISSGGTLYEPFIIRDFKGGTITGAIYMGMSSYGYSPFRQFTLMNVNTKLKVDYGAYVIGIANIYASSSHNMDVAPLVGKDATSDTSFIQLKSGAYLISKYDESTQITTLDIYGGAKTNEFSVTVEKLDKTASSKDFIFPISWMYHVTLNNGEYEMCEGNRFRLLPGAEFKVAQGATLRINYLSIYDSFIDTTSTRPYPSKYPSSSSLNGIDLPAAKMTVNGTLYATAVGGRIYTEVDGAVVKVEDLDTSDNISVAVKITNNEPAAYGLANAYVSSRSTFNTTLKLYYIDAIGNILGSTGYTQTNKTFTSYTDGSTHNWKSNPEITSYPEIVEITFTGVDSAGNPYYVRTDEAVRYDANGKPEFYTFEYDHELGGNQKIQVFAGAEIIFTLSHNQVFSATGATSFKYSDLTLASNKDSTTYNVIWEADSSKKDKFRVLATVGLIITNTAYTETFEISYTDSNNDGFYDKASIKIQNNDGGGLLGVSKDATKFSVMVNGVSGTVTSKQGGWLTKYIASYTYSSSEFIHSDSKPIYEIVVSP